MSDDTSTLKRVCLEVLQAASANTIPVLGEGTLPQIQRASMYMEQTGPGSHTGRTEQFNEVNRSAIWEVVTKTCKTEPAWLKAKALLEDHISKNRIVGSFGPIDVENHCLARLAINYFISANSFSFKETIATTEVSRLLTTLNTSEVEFTGLIALAGFTAENSFSASNTIQVRPILHAELLRLGRLRPELGPMAPQLWPQSDWWIAEVKTNSPRGSSSGQIAIHSAAEELGLALRAFKSGACSFGIVGISPSNPYDALGEMFGGTLSRISKDATTYSMTKAETAEFPKYWHRFRSVMTKPHHYLQLPIRRLRSAGTRQESEDALVDYVIGLEALLGTEQEKTELSYRFRMRGAVLLADNSQPRKALLAPLKELYELRSATVHGSHVAPEKLKTALPFAESALRRIWNWYFEHWPNETSNKKAVQEIDDMLVG